MRSKLGRVFSPNRVETEEEPIVLGKSDPKEELPLFVFEKLEREDDEQPEKDEDEETSEKEENDSIKKTESIQLAADELVSNNTREICDKMIAQAASEASRLIEEGHARAQAEYAAALRDAASAIEAEREKACQIGRAEAAAGCRDEIIECVTKIEELICRLESDHAAFITGYENDLKWLALEISRQILSDTIESDNKKLCSLVMAAVRSAKGARWMKVELSDKMAGILSTLQAAVEAEMPAGSVEFKLVSAPNDHCIVETPEKVFDASFSQQIENLKVYFANEQGV